ncbi:hypothetical protein Fmac_014937 [Flemingia macrophylla]|uniref:Uncharacterized protein n=1 Tax=Flemingia macrophylla TaxID=520843 RepID=A0ABD1MD78_9FABA
MKCSCNAYNKGGTRGSPPLSKRLDFSISTWPILDSTFVVEICNSSGLVEGLYALQTLQPYAGRPPVSGAPALGVAMRWAHRSISTRRGYERLGKESATTALLGEGFKRSTSLPSWSNSSRKMSSGSTFGDINLQRNPTKKANNNSEKKSHPLLSFLALRRKKRTTARPEFARYLEYLNEGGVWDLKSNKPDISHTKSNSNGVA